MFKKITLAAALSIASVGALAADEPKWYAGVDVVRADFKDSEKQDLRGGLFVGYRINDTWAVEGQVARLGKFADSSTVDQYAISGVASVPLGGSRFKAFGRLGLGHMEVKGGAANIASRDNKIAGVYGLGLSYDFTPTISGRAEIQKANVDTTRVSTGVAFRF
ncbi:MAG: porin family protein [Pseudomonadota bacterium]